MIQKIESNSSKSNTAQIPMRLGFVPLNDAAPFMLARELGIFSKHGLDVHLSRELGWASIRDRVATRALTAAQALVGLPFSARSHEERFIVPLVTSLQGNGITVSKQYHDEGCKTPSTILQQHKKRKSSRPPTFAVVSRYGSHLLLIRKWLQSGGIDPKTEVNIVVLPPPQMVPHLRAGHIDGYCVGEPWNTVGVMADIGFCVVTSAELLPCHPEKVLMMTESFVDENRDQTLRLVLALLEACKICESPEMLPVVSQILSHHDYLNLSAEILLDSLQGNIIRNSNSALDSVRPFMMFSGSGMNEPDPKKAEWAHQKFVEAGVFERVELDSTAFYKRLFRCDFYDEASSILESS